MVIIENVKDFVPEHIFECGQCFRWEKETDGSYTGIAYGHVINVRTEAYSLEAPKDIENPVRLILDNSSQDEYDEIWLNYFDLDRDYGVVKSILSKNDTTMEKAIKKGHGIRILNQEKWETIISFLISQNNNIPRIKKCIQLLCDNFGKYAGEYKDKKYYSIPGPDVLSKLTVSDLGICKLGYRAKYIIETAKEVEEKGIEETFSYLTSLCGVGPKVANCILLFSMKKIESFPIDVWVKRVMNQLYGLDENDVAGMQKYASEHFGEYGGIAQQYLFYYIRER